MLVSEGGGDCFGENLEHTARARAELPAQRWGGVSTPHACLPGPRRDHGYAVTISGIPTRRLRNCVWSVLCGWWRGIAGDWRTEVSRTEVHHAEACPQLWSPSPMVTVLKVRLPHCRVQSWWRLAQVQGQPQQNRSTTYVGVSMGVSVLSLCVCVCVCVCVGRSVCRSSGVTRRGRLVTPPRVIMGLTNSGGGGSPRSRHNKGPGRCLA